MLPGKTYTPEDVIKILRKRVWLIVVPWAIVAATTAAVARKLPDVYVSKALIQVTPPQVPDSIVRSTSTISLGDRLAAIQQTILSRTRLEGIIQELNLYEKERRTEIMQDVVENMIKDITVAPTKGDAFTVQFQGRDPVMVMKVAEKLAALFKQESMNEGERRAKGTTTFVESAVEDAKRKLVDTEDQLKKYRLAHSGELPSQAMANQQAIQGIQLQLQSLTQSLNNDANTKLLLERQIADLESQADSAAGTTAADSGTPTAQSLATAKAQLAQMQARGMKADHPDYQRLTRAIRDLTQQADAEARRVPVGAAVSPIEQARQKRLADLRGQLEQLTNQIEEKQADEKKLRANAAVYQQRVDMVPVRDAELIELTRDYENYTKIYNNMVAAREQSNMAENLAGRQIGEQFTLVDAARLPQKPSSPNRLLINFFGILGGLALGIGLVGFVEYRDNSFKTDTEITRVLGLPVLAVVPLMKSDDERRADFRKRLFMNLGWGSAVCVCLAVLTYTFVFMR